MAGRNRKIRQRFYYGQAAARRGVHVPSERGMTMQPGDAIGLSARAPRNNCVDFVNGKALYIYSKGATELSVPVKVIGESKKAGKHIYHIVRGASKHFPDGIDRWVYGC